MTMDISPEIPLNNLLDMIIDAVCVVDEQDKIVFISSACERVFGYSPGEMKGMYIFDLVHPDDREKTFNESRKVMSGAMQAHFENRYIRKDGSTVHIMWSARWSEDHKLRIGVARDITKRKHAELVREAVYAISEAANAARDLPSMYQQIHRIIGELIPATNFCVALYDPASQQLNFPYYVDEHSPGPPAGNLDSNPRIAQVIRSGMPLLMQAGNAAEIDHTGGERSSLSWLGVPLKSEQGIIGMLSVQSYSGSAFYTATDRDLLQFVSTQIAAAITRKTILTRLEYMAQYDPLTGLPNRELFLDRLRVAMTRSQRAKTLLAILFIDLDNFKPVNDSLGHAAGDALLQQVGGRLKRGVRASDTVARFAGDEFVVLLEGVDNINSAGICAEKIRRYFDQPFAIEQHAVDISPSIGMVIYPLDGDDENTLLKYADQAMYDAKKQGGNRIQLKNASA